jgi:hypothetical protein
MKRWLIVVPKADVSMDGEDALHAGHKRELGV